MDVTTEYSCRPFAIVAIDDTADSTVLDDILNTIEDDERARGPVVSYDRDTRRLELLFQLDAPTQPLASALATELRDRALGSAGLVDVESAGLAIVAGGPEWLP